MERKVVTKEGGKYSVKIDIKINEWKTMLMDNDIFDEKSMNVIRKWYEQIDHQATSKEIMTQYADEYVGLKNSPFNGIVIGLGKRIIKRLNRFEVFRFNGKKTYWLIPFEGWYENYRSSGLYGN